MVEFFEIRSRDGFSYRRWLCPVCRSSVSVGFVVCGCGCFSDGRQHCGGEEQCGCECHDGWS